MKTKVWSIVNHYDGNVGMMNAQTATIFYTLELFKLSTPDHVQSASTMMKTLPKVSLKVVQWLQSKRKNQYKNQSKTGNDEAMGTKKSKGAK